MYRYYNAHPQNKIVGDCVKRAICIAENKSYKQVSLELNRLKKITGAEKFNDNQNWKTYINNKGYKKISFPAIKGQDRMNGFEFAKQYNNGTYILRLARHLTVCVNGVILDIWDCRHKCVYNAWKVK